MFSMFQVLGLWVMKNKKDKTSSWSFYSNWERQTIGKQTRRNKIISAHVKCYEGNNTMVLIESYRVETLLRL